MSTDAIGIGEPSPPGISAKDRRWAILQWLSVKLQSSSYEEILEAARQFEEYISGDVEGRQVSESAISNIAKLDPVAGKIVAASVKEDVKPEFAPA